MEKIQIKRLFWAIFLLVVNASYGYSFEKCLALFKNEELLKAEKCFSQTDKNDILYPYSLYYRIIVKTVYDEDISHLLKEMDRFRDTAVYSYTNLYLSSIYRHRDGKAGKVFLRKVNKKALDKDDLPFYQFLRAVYLKNREEQVHLATKYGYERFYGYPSFLKMAKKLSNREIFRAVDGMIKKRMYRRAFKSLSFARESTTKDLYMALMYGRFGNFKKAFYYLEKLPDSMKGRVIYRLLLYHPKYGTKKKLFRRLVELGEDWYVEKAANYFLKKNFYRRNWKEFDYFSSFIPPNSKYYTNRVWFNFLKLYITGRKGEAGRYLERKIKHFQDKDMIYYWLYLAYRDIDGKKSGRYLKKAAAVNRVSFYSVRAREKLGKELFRIKKVHIPDRKDRRLELIKKLKYTDYYWAYREADLYNKMGSRLLLSKVFPEITAIYYVSRVHISKLSYPKPFSHINNRNITYAVMRRESFFNPYVVSVANAVGLMQIIPPTAKWIAKKKKDYDFDITHLFIPEINIDYGVWYIDYLNRLFDGNIFYQVAAYNGGPGTVKKVLRKNRIRTMEEFIELHPYTETRHYVKYVYTNYKAYQYLYGNE
ncbi:MAG: lytic transglycosylase domain-containing protein [Aquificae bacterium]|nr:lytic transglycosylase domain-containing protein [Aquificota bacterium]